MCLVLLALRVHPRFPLVIAANRDEFFERPTEAAHWWPPDERLLAGRDVRAGGTWLGVTLDGRVALVTNVRQGPSDTAPRSRGQLVVDYLEGSAMPREALQAALAHGDEYGGFNLLLGRPLDLWYGSNRGLAVPLPVADGVHGLSNSGLDTPWPKVVRGREALTDILTSDTLDTEALFAMLADEHRPADAELPETGVPLELERVLASAFIRSPAYGTRASTVLTVGVDGRVGFVERRFGPDGPLGETRHGFSLGGTV